MRTIRKRHGLSSATYAQHLSALLLHQRQPQQQGTSAARNIPESVVAAAFPSSPQLHSYQQTSAFLDSPVQASRTLLDNEPEGGECETQVTHVQTLDDLARLKIDA